MRRDVKSEPAASARKTDGLPVDVVVRLRMLELAHRSDREPSQVIDVADAYAAFALKGDKPQAQG